MPDTITAPTTAPAPLEWAPLWVAMKADWKAGRETWHATTEAMYDDMLNVLPPAAQRPYEFLVGEEWTHTDDGQGVFACFRWRRGDTPTARYMTLRQFYAMKR